MENNNKIILCDSDKMLNFFDLLQKEYNKNGNKPDEKINISNVLKVVFSDE